MFKKTAAQEDTLTEDIKPVAEIRQELPETASPDELGRLRDILFGSQSRTIEKRLADLEAGLQSSRRELTDLLNDKFNILTDSTSTQVNDTRREFAEKLEKQGTDQSSQLRSVQKELLDRLERQHTEQTAQLSAAQKQLSDSIEKLAADLMRQIRETHKELSERMDKSVNENAERLRSLQTETRQRDDNLRQELLAMAASLDGKKTSRQDLGQMLMELGLRLRQDSESGS
jgi:ribosome recycling factor